MTKGKQLFLVNSLLSWFACFQTHASASSFNTMTQASLNPSLPSYKEASFLLMFLLFPTAATFFFLKHPSLTRTSEIISPVTLSDNNLRNNIPWHTVRAAIREEPGGKNRRGTCQNYPPIAYYLRKWQLSVSSVYPLTEKKKKKKFIYKEVVKLPYSARIKMTPDQAGVLLGLHYTCYLLRGWLLCSSNAVSTWAPEPYLDTSELLAVFVQRGERRCSNVSGSIQIHHFPKWSAWVRRLFADIPPHYTVFIPFCLVSCFPNTGTNAVNNIISIR